MKAFRSLKIGTLDQMAGKLVKPGVAIADMSGVHAALLKTKSY
jgi:hypothetical protein